MTMRPNKRVDHNFDDHWLLEKRTGCHVWQAAVSKGYGRLRVGGKGARAYRFAWERAHGPIPAGVHILHRCNNTLCVNPAHLYAGTHRDNMQDKARAGRCNSPRGEQHGRARLTAAQVDELRALVAGGTLQRDAARRFGISQAHASDIIRGKAWK